MDGDPRLKTYLHPVQNWSLLGKSQSGNESLNTDKSRFTMYGASAQLVITMKGGSVNGFTLVCSILLILPGAPN